MKRRHLLNLKDFFRYFAIIRPTFWNFSFLLIRKAGEGFIRLLTPSNPIRKPPSTKKSRFPRVLLWFYITFENVGRIIAMYPFFFLIREILGHYGSKIPFRFFRPKIGNRQQPWFILLNQKSFNSGSKFLRLQKLLTLFLEFFDF